MMKTILVADDEFEILSSIRVVLESEGYRVLTCSNGKEALALVEDMNPDLLITDSMMPLLTGFELLKELHRSKPKLKLPTIFMSSVRPSAKQKEAKFEAVLLKPFTLDELITAVNRVLRH